MQRQARPGQQARPLYTTYSHHIVSRSLSSSPPPSPVVSVAPRGDNLSCCSRPVEPTRQRSPTARPLLGRLVCCSSKARHRSSVAAVRQQSSIHPRGAAHPVLRHPLPNPRAEATATQSRAELRCSPPLHRRPNSSCSLHRRSLARSLSPAPRRAAANEPLQGLNLEQLDPTR